MEKICALMDDTSITEEVEANYDLSNGRIQEPNYQKDLALRRLCVSPTIMGIWMNKSIYPQHNNNRKGPIY